VVGHDFPIPLLTYALEPIALASAIILTYINHQRTRRSSSILLLFWPAYIAGILIWAHSLYSEGFLHQHVVFALRCAVGIFGFLTFILECLGTELDSKNADDATEELENPLLTANIFSKWSFGWLTPLMKKGVSRYITENDLPPLLARDESAKLSHDLQKALAKQ
jgi:ATP-binding cassette subfamily C (CFTR/MRP) protein 1